VADEHPGRERPTFVAARIAKGIDDAFDMGQRYGQPFDNDIEHAPRRNIVYTGDVDSFGRHRVLRVQAVSIIYEGEYTRSTLDMQARPRKIWYDRKPCTI
jgi:hypothetical protein